MKIETYLNAMEKAYEMVDWIVPGDAKWDRQYHAFRARILRLDAEKSRAIEEWETYFGFYIGDVEFIETMADKDAEIERLQKELKAINRPFDDPSGRYELTNEEWSDG